jgi:hypothetical protein
LGSGAGEDRRRSKFRMRNDDLVWRELNGEVIILEMDSGSYLNLNGSAKVLWEALGAPAELNDLAALLVKVYGIPHRQASNDAQAFLDDLSARKLIEQVDDA